MQHIHFDAIVIGSGPGGEGAAMGLVKQGKNVAVIERYDSVGGGCTHWGTIPPKPSAMQLAELSNLTKIHSTAIILAPYAPLSLKSSSMLKA